MPFFVRITRASPRGRLAVPIFAFDLSESELRRLVIQPYEQGKTITIDGRTVPADDIAAIDVIEATDSIGAVPLSQLRALWREGHRRQAGNYIASKGTRVTDQFIKGPPGGHEGGPASSAKVKQSPIAAPTTGPDHIQIALALAAILSMIITFLGAPPLLGGGAVAIFLAVLFLRRWLWSPKIGARVLAGVGVCLTAVGGALLAEEVFGDDPDAPPESSTVVDSIDAEEERLGQLKAGAPLASFRDILDGDRPDLQFRITEPECPSEDVICASDVENLPSSPLTRAIFVRDYDVVQAIVDADDAVVAFSVVSWTPDLHPSFDLGYEGTNESGEVERQYVTLGQTTFEQASFGTALGGFCDGRVQYFETSVGTTATLRKAHAVGITTVGAPNAETGPICDARDLMIRCDVAAADINVVFNLNFEGQECFLRSPKSEAIRDLPVNTYVETAPDVSYVTSTMLAPLEPEVAPFRSDLPPSGR